MRKIRLVLCVFLSLLLVGCGTSEPKQCTTADVLQLVEKYYSCDYSVCAETKLESVYNNLTERDKKIVQLFCEKISISAITGESNEFSISLECPDLSSLSRIAYDDVNGFVRDFENLSLSQTSNEQKIIFAKEYLYKILSMGGLDNKSVQIPVTVQEFKFADDLELSTIVREVINYDYETLINGISDSQSQVVNTEIEEEKDSFDKNSFTRVSSAKTFMFETKQARFLVYDIVCREGSDAIEAIHTLSSSNKVLQNTEGVCYYLEYKIKNLSNESVVVQDCMKIADSDGYVYESSVVVSGLQSVAEIFAGDSAQFSSFLIGPTESEIYWCARDVYGSYIIDVVLE